VGERAAAKATRNQLVEGAHCDRAGKKAVWRAVEARMGRLDAEEFAAVRQRGK